MIRRFDVCNKDVHQQIIDDAVDIAASEGRAPEQGDFMTASVINHKRMSPEEQRLLQSDLQAAELGASSEGLGSSFLFDEESYYEEEPDLYGETCPNCGFDKNYCRCPDEEDLSAKFFCLSTGCPNNPDWYEFESGVSESDVEETKKRFIQLHAEQCGCGAEIKVSVDER
ncbi:MAG: hypothetical protein ACD_13C00262G0001 [uncultured bacterium]|uniref:Uncharacterized protein n=1 Tax=candidate division WWE3 bacterium TaxID=2053526 RepID=A0A656PLY6_UNCKA|nr:hypothetical protein P147_WWE3C00001G0003 [candidate division WWE3 bacterium RAAC2_WWE3_1]EKE12200.1 MAG: hypothetical protein ACD_13C00262G0001 [uncultured bacterium]KKT03911.1 MAG: hypothetical protein UV83_C0018G0003 [candidate division WWE3 bacterium GW2011_GWE2_43_18]KKT08175.1 MAG: hypothetical protein UV87_C0006G0003 [candidate division WWE3 bacterium GW2011_GWD1_43_201]KKT10840.1 MAG: hypothetical protein UV90_C0002G0003 [candidate division WWE3 bacterium GW2011_GWA2_43_24]KKT26360.